MPSLQELMCPDGTCLGCGAANPQGYRAKFRREGDGVLGDVTFGAHATGLPGMAHGGALVTVMECLATWTILALVDDRSRVPVGSADAVRFHAPVRVGVPLRLTGTLARPPSGREPAIVKATAHDQAGNLIAECESTVAHVPVAKFLALAGLDAMPREYHGLFPPS